MSKEDNKKYYWLKLDKDFFKRHDITIIESMPNGKDYILFYLKLLCESTSHEGYLRFSPTIPYNVEMLASLTKTNIDVVRSAIKIFTELGMMAFLDDGTLYLEAVQKMIGSETQGAIRKREQRRLASSGGLGDIVPDCPPLVPNCPIEIDKDIEIEKEIELKDIRNEMSNIGAQAHDMEESDDSIDDFDYSVIPDKWDIEKSTIAVSLKVKMIKGETLTQDQFKFLNAFLEVSSKNNEPEENNLGPTQMVDIDNIVS